MSSGTFQSGDHRPVPTGDAGFMAEDMMRPTKKKLVSLHALVEDADANVGTMHEVVERLHNMLIRLGHPPIGDKENSPLRATPDGTIHQMHERLGTQRVLLDECRLLLSSLEEYV